MGSDTTAALVGAIAGGVCGALAGGGFSLMVAPTLAEREERGRMRIRGRRSIASALIAFHYAVSETRGTLFRLGGVVDRDEFERAALTFASTLIRSADSLPWIERSRLRWRTRRLMGPGVIRFVELRPPKHFGAGADSARLQVIADTRPWTSKAKFDLELCIAKPTDDRWSRVLKAIQKMQRDYPVASADP